MNPFRDANAPVDVPIASIAQAVVHTNATEKIQELQNQRGAVNAARRAKAKAKAASASLTSRQTQGTIPLPIYQEREAHCKVCPHMIIKDDGLMYCNKCGCGDWKYAALNGEHGKLWSPATSCPILNFTVGAFNKTRTKFYTWQSSKKEWLLVWEFEPTI